MQQSGQGGSGGGLHVFGRHCFSARSDDTDRCVDCDFLLSAWRVTRSSSTEKVCAGTNVSERSAVVADLQLKLLKCFLHLLLRRHRG